MATKNTDYARVSFLIGECDRGINERKTPLTLVKDNGDYLREAGEILQKASPAEKRNNPEYTRMEERVKTAADNTVVYAKAAGAQRVDEAYNKTAEAANYVRRELGRISPVQLKASKNPLKWVRVGKPSIAVVDDKLETARYSVDDARNYVKSLTNQLKLAGFDVSGYEAFKRLSTQLEATRKTLETRSADHQGYVNTAQGPPKKTQTTSKNKGPAKSASGGITKLRGH